MEENKTTEIISNLIILKKSTYLNIIVYSISVF